MGVPHGVDTSWHLLPRLEGWRRLTLPDAFQKPLPLGREGFWGAMTSSQAEDSQKTKAEFKKPSVAIDEGCPGQLGWYFHQQLWISGQCGQDFSLRLRGEAMRWQTWVSHASPSLRVGDNSLWRKSEWVVDVGGDRSMTCVSW